MLFGLTLNKFGLNKFGLNKFGLNKFTLDKLRLDKFGGIVCQDVLVFMVDVDHPQDDEHAKPRNDSTTGDDDGSAKKDDESESSETESIRHRRQDSSQLDEDFDETRNASYRLGNALDVGEIDLSMEPMPNVRQSLASQGSQRGRAQSQRLSIGSIRIGAAMPIHAAGPSAPELARRLGSRLQADEELASSLPETNNDLLDGVEQVRDTASAADRLELEERQDDSSDVIECPEPFALDDDAQQQRPMHMAHMRPESEREELRRLPPDWVPLRRQSHEARIWLGLADPHLMEGTTDLSQAHDSSVNLPEDATRAQHITCNRAQVNGERPRYMDDDEVQSQAMSFGDSSTLVPHDNYVDQLPGTRSEIIGPTFMLECRRRGCSRDDYVTDSMHTRSQSAPGAIPSNLPDFFWLHHHKHQHVQAEDDGMPGPSN